MSNLVLFLPRREVDAEVNVREFVALCRDELTAFRAELDFADHVWDVTADIHHKAKGGKIRAVFSSWSTANDVSPSPMREPFQSFAKAYFRYQHSLRPTKAISSRIAALRALGSALEERGTPSPWLVDAGVFNRASQLCREAFSSAVAYRVGSQLQMLAGFMDDNRLAGLSLRWRNPIKRPSNDTARVGMEFDDRREEKMPSPYALESLARAYRAAIEPVDVVVTSVAALLCSAPDRINEILSLRADCEVREQQVDGKPAYGLRFWPSKGADPMVKWIIPSMAGVVEEALERLRVQTAQAREVSRWYEANPTALYLPASLEHMRRQERLTLPQAIEILFAKPVKSSSLESWCKQHHVPVHKDIGGSWIDFVVFERAVIALLPLRFPFADDEAGLLYSEALCVIRRNELHETKATFRCVLDMVSQGTVSTGLGNRSEHGFRSVFDRLELFEPDGGPIFIRSHQFRHYLNTLAFAGGMNDLDIAKWSGRKDIRQNSAYNHVSDRDMQARMKELTGGENRQTPTELVAQTRISLIPRAKFAELRIQAAHTTDFGFCAHDYAMSPCQVHMDCTNCNDQVCIKGDEIGEANVRSKATETHALLLEAQVAEADMAYGATPWVLHQRLTLDRLTQLIQILDDPRFPAGSVVRLNHLKPASRLQQAVDARESLAIAGDPQALAWRVVDTKELA